MYLSLNLELKTLLMEFKYIFMEIYYGNWKYNSIFDEN